MRYRNVGVSGLQVSVVGLGGWTTYGGSIQESATVERILRAAFEAGINFFDMADIYAKGVTETTMGAVLQQFPRHRLVLSSKVFWPMSDDVNDRGLSRKHIMESCHKSLKRLGTDYLDLYFCHRFDPQTPVEETLRAMDDLVHQGKVLYWGTSEWTGSQLHQVCGVADQKNLYRPQVEQPQLSLVVRKTFQDDVSPAATHQGMGLVVWSPLASGLLTGKYDDGIPPGTRLDAMPGLRDQLATPALLACVKKFKTLADELNVTRAQLALAWAAAQPGVSSVITGATRLEQLHENLGALAVTLTADRLAQMEAMFPRA